MPERTHVFQPPKGTRDFYPADMAVRRHLEKVWRDVSINHGFEEIDGPTFEHLDLYTVKSGEEIVSQLFRFQREGGDTEYALRPEFTPTLARMYAARAGSLPNPTKWFSIPNFFRAERPQRGRLREFFQWNVDIIGDPSPRADAEVIACAVGALQRLGLTSDDVKIKMSDRRFIAMMLQGGGVRDEQLAIAFGLLDKRARMLPAEFDRLVREAGLDPHVFENLLSQEGRKSLLGIASSPKGGVMIMTDVVDERLDSLIALDDLIESMGIADWCKWDHTIVRGLAYYTGMVFEVHEAAGKERAIAGGGRYDGLIELYGGPPTPAVGFAMGDVVLRLVLEDKGLLGEAEKYLRRPDVFVISSGDEIAEKEFAPLVARLRREGFHVRHSYRATKNVGKLLGEASKTRARLAVILGKELETGNVLVKDLQSGEQNPCSLGDLSTTVRTLIETQRAAERRGEGGKS